jgi:hypothetical protein
MDEERSQYPRCMIVHSTPRHPDTHTQGVAGFLLNGFAAVLDMRIGATLRTPSLRCGRPSDPFVAMTFNQYCALDARRGGSALYSCGCIIPGSEPGATDSCLAFHYGGSASSSPPSPSPCDVGAQKLAGLVAASAALCWTLAAVCLMASAVAVLVSCYRHRRCPACVAALWRPREQTVPPYLRNSTAALPATAANPNNGSSSITSASPGKQRPTTSKPKSARVPAPYYLRDCPNGGPV